MGVIDECNHFVYHAHSVFGSIALHTFSIAAIVLVLSFLLLQSPAGFLLCHGNDAGL
ncbi:hypothetical protein [uncultured Bacteroides sp.]|mgnify:CR=1 FL=1|uniref:hypothetical protein n=1 Tax=uncultured Bacteroides sp. TaxID=162156 RepID=UPI00280BF331|nr:hypothetical protein [uncultured Bacteroides sp.]